MLKKLYRLPAGQKLLTPKIFKSQSFLLKNTPNKLPVSRYGFIIKKNVDKRATARNRIRRVFRSCIEELLPNIKDGYDMLFFLEKGIIDKKRDEVYEEIRDLLSRNHILK